MTILIKSGNLSFGADVTISTILTIKTYESHSKSHAQGSSRWSHHAWFNCVDHLGS